MTPAEIAASEIVNSDKWRTSTGRLSLADAVALQVMIENAIRQAVENERTRIVNYLRQLENAHIAAGSDGMSVRMIAEMLARDLDRA